MTNSKAAPRLEGRAGRVADKEDDPSERVAPDPDNPLAREALASAAVASGKPELATRALDARSALEPRSWGAHERAARALEAVGDEVRACAGIERRKDGEDRLVHLTAKHRARSRSEQPAPV